jgi:hypothetical protein
MRSTSTRGNNSTPHRDPTDPPRRRAHTRQGHGTDANDRPPILRLISRDTGEPRWWVCDHAQTRTCAGLIAEHIPIGGTWLSTDEWQSDRGSHPSHATGAHGVHAWARDDHRDGQREVHGPTCEGAGAALRPDLRAFRGVHQPSWPLSVATDEAMAHAKRVTPALIQRMCVSHMSMHTGYT